MVRNNVGRLSGRGDYTYDKPGPWGNAGRYIGSALGSKFAGVGGAKLGEKLGSYLHYIGKIFGSGDYVTSASQVKSNTLVGSSQIPSFTHGKTSVRIQHREFLGDLISSATPGLFEIKDYQINPGLETTFPWLSQVVGNNFQQYRINGMVFEFRSMSADALNSTNTALGSVVMATDYDSTDLRFTTKSQMENTEFAVSCKPSACMIHAIECDKKQTTLSELYMRSAPPPGTADIRFYDLGRFSIATVGMQAASVNLGELWVSYDIEFLKAIKLAPGVGNGCAHYSLDKFAVLNNHPLAVLQPPLIDNIGLTFDAPAPAGNVVYFPPDMAAGSCFQIILTWVGTAAAAALPTITPANGLSFGPVATGFIDNPSPAGLIADTLTSVIWVTYDGSGTSATPPMVTYGSCTGPSAPTGGDFYVNQVNGNIV